jgi:deoxyribodipyrimidine photo-lyase
MGRRSGLQVVWFKRDLRVTDHAPLTLAGQLGPVLPLYIIEPGLWGEPDASGRHWAFIAESLQELARDLAQAGSPLVIRFGDVVDILDGIRREVGIDTLWSHQETGNGWTFGRDKRVAAWAAAHGIPWREERQSGVIRRLKDRDGWAKAWDRFMALPIEPLPQLKPPPQPLDSQHLATAADLGLDPDPCPGRQPGGRSHAISTLETFLYQRGIDYRRDMSSPVTGEMGCSRLSPHLAFGTISMREVAQATYARLRALKADPSPEARRWRASLVSFLGRLHWHCHFMQKLESEPRIEFENMHRAYDGMRPTEADPSILGAYARGETGFPFVDACLRSLAATGWINFRMRAMLMAFASYHLWQPWRASGMVLARLFTDYEPGIHWPQSQMQSGTTGINTIRMYNPVKQGYDQDPDGAFVRRWLPELGDVPDEFIHEPWRWEHAPSLIGSRYPARIVDHIEAARVARDRVWGVRKGLAYREKADAIQERHGSRKSGLRSTAVRRRAKRMPPAAQTSLDL